MQLLSPSAAAALLSFAAGASSLEPLYDPLYPSTPRRLPRHSSNKFRPGLQGSRECARRRRQLAHLSQHPSAFRHAKAH